MDKLRKIKEEIETIISYFTNEDTELDARLYFEMRIEVMLQPFTNLFSFINENATSHRAVNEKIIACLTSNSDLSLKPLFKVLNSTTFKRPHELKKIFNQIDHFAIRIAQFAYLYGTKQNYIQEFGDWSYRIHPVNFYEKGILITLNLIHFISEKKTFYAKEDFAKLADFYIRETIFKDYSLSGNEAGNSDRLYKHTQSYEIIKSKLERLNSLAIQAIPFFTKLSKVDSSKDSNVSSLLSYYQVPDAAYTPVPSVIENISEKSKQRSTGFELEFNTGTNIRSLKEAAINYQKILGWKNLYTAPHENMYNPDSDGLLYYDYSLPIRRDEQNNIIGCSLEYSSPPYTIEKDGDKYIDFLTLLKGETNAALYGNSEAHQHIYKKDINLEGMKRLVLRRAFHDKTILEAFHIFSKTHDLNRSACALLTNISSHKTEEERLRNYIIFSSLVNLAQDIPSLVKRVNRGSKYNSLNLLPAKTVEFRGMQGTFSKQFLQHYLQFNLFFVESAAQNSPIHFLPLDLKQAQELRRQDKSPLIPSKYTPFHREAFNPIELLTFDQKQYLLTCDKHTLETLETLKQKEYQMPNSLETGYHNLHSRKKGKIVLAY